MSKKKARQRKTTAPARRTNRGKRNMAAAIGLVLLLSLSGGLWAQWRATRMAPKTASLAPAPVPSPTLSLMKENIYAGGKLVATEEPGTFVSAPTALAAHTFSSARIDLNWTAAAGTIDHYQVARSQNVAGPYAIIQPNLTTTSFTDTSVTDGTAYLYQVRAVDAAGNFSLYSNIDLATAVTFADDPFPETPVRIMALHLTQLRDAINAVRATAGLSPATWHDASPQGVRIQAQHLQEMRTAVDQALSALGLPVPPYPEPNLTDARIKKSHFQELRDRVK